MQYDIWSVNTGASNATFFATNVTASGTVTLAANQIGNNGTGYKVSATSAADDDSLTITVTGIPVGRLDGGTVTETFSGASASVAYSTNYYTTVSAISRLESSLRSEKHSPSFSTLRKYAQACGKKLVVQMV